MCFYKFQLNSPNRILLLHLSIVCLSLSILYLWILINNSIMQSPLTRFNIATIPESAAISTATSSSSYFPQQWNARGDMTTHSPINESIHDSVCSVNDLLIHLLQPIGLWTISCINFDRYYAICSPLHYNTLFTTKKVRNTQYPVGIIHSICHSKKLLNYFISSEKYNLSQEFWKALMSNVSLW